MTTIPQSSIEIAHVEIERTAKCYTCGMPRKACGNGDLGAYFDPEWPAVVMGLGCAVKYEEQGLPIIAVPMP